MTSLDTKLEQCKRGGAVLFCGAGFSADCLNFESSDTIGTGGSLLALLNTELKQLGHQSGFRDLKNAADVYVQQRGEFALLNLLQGKYKIQNVSADMVEIVRFPWDRIYTTNYDNAIEIALQSAAKSADSYNNIDKIAQNIPRGGVVHLHGFAEKWDSNNFRTSCVLGADSYMELEIVKKWLDLFRNDIERAELVVFVGFNAADMHLNRVMFNVTGLKAKVFFVNRPAAEPDPDVHMTQERFGTPTYIGRRGLSEKITHSRATSGPEELRLASFVRFYPPAPSTEVPAVSQIEELFIYGKTYREQIYRDVSNSLSDYHVLRSVTKKLLSLVKAEKRILLILGDICEGKSTVAEELSFSLSITRPVFIMRHIYEDMLDEVSRILQKRPNAALFVENCFDVRDDRLASLAKLFHDSEGILVLTSRTIAAEAETAKFNALKAHQDFEVVTPAPLDRSESEALVNLVDQIAGWRDLGPLSREQKIRFIELTCRGSIPSFLLKLLQSEYVKNIYREEYNKTKWIDGQERTAIITALYISHIGHDTPLAFLSNTLRLDIGKALDRSSARSDGIRLVHRYGHLVRTVPAIGATNILVHLVPDRDIVNSITDVLARLSENLSHTDFDRFIFGQMMRYSILKSVVADRDEIDRFFDRISKIEYFRRQVLFWLQWHIAKTDFKDFPSAWKYLEQGYVEAEVYESRTRTPYNRKQLDDRKAKFFMLKAQAISLEPTELFRTLKESCDIAGKLIRGDGLTHHPFETLKIIAETYSEQKHRLSSEHQQLVLRILSNLVVVAKQKIGGVSEGFQTSTAKNALGIVDSLVNA